MDFISLNEVLYNMAECVELPPHNQDKYEDLGTYNKISKDAAIKFWNGKPKIFDGIDDSPLDYSNNQKIEWARRIGWAAGILNKALHDSPGQTQWLEYSEDKGFAVRADVANEAIEILTHASKWGNRLLNNCCNHFRNSITQGDEALAMPVLSDADDGLTIDGGILRMSRIGFDRFEIFSFLDRNEIGYSKPVTNENNDDKVITINDKRNVVAKAWLEKNNPDLDVLNSKQILNKLDSFLSFNRQIFPKETYPANIFTKGGSDWLNRDHRVIPKRPAGKKHGK